MDIYRHYRPHASDKEAVRAGQAWQGLMTILTLAMLPVVMENSSEIGFYVYAQDIMNHLMPPLVALFVAGIFTSFVNAYEIKADS